MIDPHGEPVRENYRQQGEVRERERIIELVSKEGALDSCFIGNDISLPLLIALIKGENK